MSPSSQNLNPKQAIAAMQLAIGATGDEAAEAAGVNPRTIDRWKTDDAFQEAISNARRDVYDRAIGLKVAALEDAISTLSEICRNPNAPSSARVSAAGKLLDSTRADIQGEEILERLAEVEEIVSEYRKL